MLFYWSPRRVAQRHEPEHVEAGTHAAAAHRRQILRSLAAHLLLKELKMLEHMCTAQRHRGDDATRTVHVVVHRWLSQNHCLNLFENGINHCQVFVELAHREPDVAKDAGCKKTATGRVGQLTLVEHRVDGSFLSECHQLIATSGYWSGALTIVELLPAAHSYLSATAGDSIKKYLGKLRVNIVVGIDKGNIIAPHHVEAGVAGIAQATIGLVHNHYAVVTRGIVITHCAAAIGAAVVHEDYLKLAIALR